jgi:hypothetical protein
MQEETFAAHICVFVAFAVGIVLGSYIMSSFSEEQQCERQNNVYDCTRIYIPTPIEEDNQ